MEYGKRTTSTSTTTNKRPLSPRRNDRGKKEKKQRQPWFSSDYKLVSRIHSNNIAIEKCYLRRKQTAKIISDWLDIRRKRRRRKGESKAIHVRHTYTTGKRARTCKNRARKGLGEKYQQQQRLIHKRIIGIQHTHKAIIIIVIMGFYKW